MFIFRNGDIANIKLASDNIRDNFVFKFMKNCYASLNIIYSSLQLLSRLPIAPSQGLQGFEQSA